MASTQARELIDEEQHQGSPPDDPPIRSRGATGGPSLVRLTVNLTKRSHESLQKISEQTGMGKTDVVNRALQVYSLVEDLLDRNNGHLTVLHADGRQERIYIL
jgi:hypothetical protein